MNFVSYEFICFFSILILLNLYAPPKSRFFLLLFSSYLFYATWSIPFIGVILFTTTFDFWMSQIISKSDSSLKRKLALMSGLAINLLILFYFKYFNFFLDATNNLFQLFSLQIHTPKIASIILPLGISFYTFEAISYMVDVYKGNQPAKSWLDYNFYIMYFPHLISGPIIRFCEFNKQYAKSFPFPTISSLVKGFELVVLGYLFKIIIADQFAPLADHVFNAPQQASVLATYLGVLAFTVQIYFDFMGYTHIARGVSLFFNIELPLNFNNPYNATNISDFWTRWHISLSQWIRDYLYFPLGGSKNTLIRTVLNLLVIMTICGIWHGAGWGFLIWGFYHGILLAGYHLHKHFSSNYLSRAFKTQPLYQLLSLTTTFLLVSVGWVFFRAADWKAAMTILSSLVHIETASAEVFQLFKTGHLIDIATFIFALLCCFSGPWLTQNVQALYRPLPRWCKVQIACLLLILCWVLSSEGAKSFIYFQF